MKFDFVSLMGKKIKLVDIDGQIFKGIVEFIEDPNNSEDGQWWLNIDVNNFGLLTIPEPEIKSIEVL